MEKPDLRDSVLANLRSVTQSCKGGVPLERLQRDYRDLLGTPIPYRELGYNTLEKLIRSIPDVISLNRDNHGQLVAIGKADESTSHIVSLVSRQKTEPRRPGRSKRMPFHVGLPLRRAPPMRYSTKISPFHSHPVQQQSLQRTYQRPNPSYNDEHVPSYSKSKERDSPPVVPKSEPYPRRTYETAPRFLRMELEKKRVAEELAAKPPTPEPFLNAGHSSEIPAPVSVVKVPSPVKMPQKGIKVNTPAPSEPLPPTNDPVRFVEHYAKKKGIPIKYNTMPMGQKSKSYISTLKLGNKTYQSYPNEANTGKAAEKEAAKAAVADIQECEEKKDMFHETPIDNADSIQILVNRVFEIVCDKPSGIFSFGLYWEYANKFRETLPDNWIAIIQQNTNLDVEVPFGTQVPAGTFILRRGKGTSSGNATPSSTSSKTGMFSDELDTTTLRNSISNISVGKIPSIKLPDGNNWGVFISCVQSAASIFARLVDYADEFAEMSEEMNKFYKNKSYPVQEAFENNLYAASFDGDSEEMWHRVLVEEIGADGQISCYFVDEGDAAYTQISNLQELNSRFLTLPYQALHIELNGLEDYENEIKLEHLNNHLHGLTLIAQVMKRSDNVYSVILYNTYDDDDVNINEMLLREITILKSLKWELPKICTTSLAYLTHVTENGEIFLRFTCPETSLLEEELKKLSPKFEVASTNFSLIPVNAMCVAKYRDEIWCRALVISYPDNTYSEVEVIFVDYGNTSLVSNANICELEPVNKFLASLPPQAVKCDLQDALPSLDLEWTTEAINRLTELAPIDEEIHIRVISEANGEHLPKVNLHKRNKDNCLTCINSILVGSPELFRKKSNAATCSMSAGLYLPLQSEMKPSNLLSSFIPDVAFPAAIAEEQMARRLVGKSPTSDTLNWVLTPDMTPQEPVSDQPPKDLRLPDIPNVGEEFDVVVILAAHPSNFVVQPFLSTNELGALMNAMKHFYSNEENYTDMHPSLLNENNFYAALHDDKQWYRVRMNKVIMSDPVMAVVHFVDYGDLGTVTMPNLQPLWQRFRTLPCQAIKASLSGVKPLKADWETLHCIEFQKMVRDKPFVSIVQRKLVCNDSDFPTVLELTLIDTSPPDNDIYIDKMLIEQNIARPAI